MKTQLLASPDPRVATTTKQAARSPRSNPAKGRFAGQHRRRMFRADMLTVALWASLAAALALWLADGGVSTVGNLTQAVTAVGIAGRTCRHGPGLPDASARGTPAFRGRRGRA
ncbi:hypothetical protein [Arthrobacter sp. NA-172]|uniref:hypothetical protein n=1 Tax=Arthrobacter sp. NA-172 TaxID=3367524 RepID=UPI003755227D